MVNDLREALDLLKADPPPWNHDIEDFVLAGRRLERRRRLRRLAGSCLAAGLVTGTAFIVPTSLLTGGNREPSPVVALNAPGAAPPGESASPSPGSSASVSLLPSASGGTSTGGVSGRGSVAAPSQPFGFTLRGYRVGSFTVGDPNVASATYQRAPVYEDGKVELVPDGGGRFRSLPASQADLVVYRAGAFVPPSLNDAQATTIAGRPARWQTFSTHVLFAWEYAGGAWATLQTVQTADSTLITSLPRIAAGLTGGSETAAKVPYQLSYLPAGFAPAEVAVRAHSGEPLAGPGDGTVSSVLFTNRKPTGTAVPVTPIQDWRKTPGGGVLVVEVAAEKVSSSASPPGRQPQIDFLCEDSSTVCYRVTEDGRYRVTVESTGDVPVAERLQVLQGLKLTAVDTPSTWVDAGKALSRGR